MTVKKKTYRFRPCKELNKYQVLVFEAGKVGVQRFHQIKIIGDCRGEYKPYCNCLAKKYSKHPNETMCCHEKEFMVWMEKFVTVDGGKRGGTSHGKDYDRCKA